MARILREGIVGLLSKPSPTGEPPYDYGVVCPKCGCMFQIRENEKVENGTVPGYFYTPCQNPDCGHSIYSKDWTPLHGEHK